MQKPSIQQSYVQKMQISLAMQQSLAVLQMPITDLQLWLQDQTEQNPLIECDEDFFYNKQTMGGKAPPSCDELPEQPSLFSHLMTQARQICSEKTKLKIFEWIIGNLEPTGFLPSEKETGLPPFASEDYQSCLRSIEQFDPPGIGAKNLEHSLLLQLEFLNKTESVAYKIIQHDFSRLLQKDFAFLQKKYQVELDILQRLIQTDIAPLDPYPGYRFCEKQINHLPIDVYLTEENGIWDIQIPQPTITVGNLHQKTDSIEDRAFFSSHTKKARWILTALEKRRETLYKITSYLVVKQQDYLLGSSSSLVPLNGREIAKKLQLHESTIARALADKNLSGPLGIIPLNQLLSKNLTEDISCDQAKKLLLKLIAEENKKSPLSDRKLLEKMQALGIPCARRTVTKYRQSLHIPSTRQRKA